MLEKTLKANRLFDFYGALLTENQRELFRLYYREDWSLSEVAAELECSRQAVHDGLERSMERLNEYEESLGLIETFQERSRRLRELKQSLEAEDVDPAIIAKIESLGEMTPEHE
jgi:predicted DNA-binding protein YlxM (UPF0122 family)